MPIVIDPGENHELDINGAIFTVRGLTGRQMLEFSSRLSEIETQPVAVYEILHEVLVGWKGVVKSSGEELPCTPENIDALPVEIAAKIFEFASSLSTVAGDDQGN